MGKHLNTWNKVVFIGKDGEEHSSITQFRSVEYSLKMAYSLAITAGIDVRLYIGVKGGNTINPNTTGCKVFNIVYQDIGDSPVLDFEDELANM